MLNTRIDPADWTDFFDRLTRGRGAVASQATARVRIVRPDEFQGTHAYAWLPFMGLTWEPKEATLTLALDGLDHRVGTPLEVWADEAADGEIQALVLTGPDGQRDEIAFRMAGLRPSRIDPYHELPPVATGRP